MSDGLPLQNSIEDEGIDMDDSRPQSGTLSDHLRPKFSFAGIPDDASETLNGLQDLQGINRRQDNVASGTGSLVDFADGSDVVQRDSSASPSSLENRHTEWADIEAVDDEGNPYVDEFPVPDIDDPHQLDTLQLAKIIQQQSFHIPAGTDAEEIEEPATEIHVEEGEGLKID